MNVSRDDIHRASDDPLHAECPGRSVFETITGRWSLLILWSLRGGSLRFFELRNNVEGISERVLSHNLKALRRDGLLARHVEPTVPPKVSYSLTDVGAELIEVMDGLTGWIARRLPDVEAARASHDAAEGSGSP
ncbi:helix-turn-helix domain-containing protein [Stappia sp. MMSF_3263]|uniref:winged helix-turn-helix transcriptional regulator n=1 Tax=Stappia sp. MMSF_3263 TaxID=3046693 RepID=UPI00273FA8C0|nr:helix-turn-helix domain-containing protein [Stappia sp. MMSF_3263]